MKKCFKCGIEKELSEFYRHPQMADGTLNKCKECAKKDVHERYDQLKDDPAFVLGERERTRQKFHRLNYRDRYRETRDQAVERLKRYRENYPEKNTAHSLLRSAIKSGKIKRQPCEICGEVEVEAHHEDYSKPLEVRWLCIKHHNERHVEIRKQKLLDGVL